MIYFTADTHFDHARILDYCPRRLQRFGNLETMNDVFLDNINKTVDRNDVLWFLGDFSWGRAGHFRQRIRCRKIHGVRGNHDLASLGKQFSTFELMSSIKKPRIHLCHYPLESWSAMYHGGLHFHGHCHGRLPKVENRLDVGIDNIFNLIGEWRPISLDEALELCSQKTN